MGIVLKVTPETLEKMSGDIQDKISQIKSQFQEIESEIKRTPGYWDGEASEVHKKQFDTLKPEIQEALERLQRRPEELLKMAGLYQTTENTSKEATMSLSEDVII